MAKSAESKISSWALFLGVILFLVGIYAGCRIVINFIAFPKYPTVGVLSINFSGNPTSIQTEENCTYMSTYYEQDGKTIRAPTPQEKEIDKQNQSNCLMSLSSTREATKINDISQAGLFLILGLGLMIARKFLPL